MTAKDEAGLRSSTWRWARVGAALGSLWLAFQLLLIAQHWLLAIFSVVEYVVFGGVLALVAWPAVDALEARRVPRGVAIAIVLLGGAMTSVSLGYFVGTELVAEARSLLNQLPRYEADVNGLFNANIAPLLASRGIHVSLPTLVQTGAHRAAGGNLLARLPELLFTGITSVLMFAA